MSRDAVNGGEKRGLSFSRWWAWALVMLPVCAGVWAAEHDVTSVPPFLLQGVDPNIMLTVDDSGSMAYSFMPEEVRYLNGSSGTLHTYNNFKVWALSANVNRIYYDPTVTYRPPVGANGASLPNASFTAAWLNGYAQAGTTVNLQTHYRATWGHAGTPVAGNSLHLGPNPTAESPQAAYYYQFNPDCSLSNPEYHDSCYAKVTVTNTDDGSTAPPGVDGYTNFANWYSYYRTRLHVAKAAASLSFANLPDSVRVGRQTINSTTVHGVRYFTGTNRQAFWNWLFGLSASGSTPLPSALVRAGNYFSTAEPYRADPANNNTAELSCRQNFHVLMSDGAWDVNPPSGFNQNFDNQSHSIPGGGELDINQYVPRAPYTDSNSGFLADVAFYYWINDLRPSLTNDVPTNTRDTSTKLVGTTSGPVNKEDIFWNPANNPAHWQHMVTHTVGMGVSGTLDYPGDYNALLSGSKSWGTDKVDDLWHAAINSRGRYLSAQDTSGLVQSFSEIISQILDNIGSYAPVAVNSGEVSSSARVFLSRFNSADWSGQLLSRPISDGTNCEPTPRGHLCPVEWDAGCKLTGGLCAETGAHEAAKVPNSRKIITRSVTESADGLASDIGGAIAFRWDQLSELQQNQFRSSPGDESLPLENVVFGQKRLNWIRGERTHELVNEGVFRNRNSILGDAIGSPPLHVGVPSRFYPGRSQIAISELSSYHDFRLAHAERQSMVYLGANDGMLHAFNAENGEELFAYIPGMVFERLPELTRPDYVHRNYVDGPTTENDVYFNDNWHSVLLSGLGLGGQGYFALNITNPAAVSESTPGTLAMWEFSDADDPDMGYSYSNASIVRMANGRWAAVFGNGINSTDPDGRASETGNAVIFVVDIEDGTVIAKLDTHIGREDDPLGQSRPNGIMGIFPADLRGNDFIVDRIYGTDIFGNVWAFDVSSENANDWGPAYGSKAVPAPLYTAESASGQRQPITSPPVVIRHPQRSGALVMFGTGRYLGGSDVGDIGQQSFYGIWDRMSGQPSGQGRTRLQEQTIETTLNHIGNYDVRTVSNHLVKWDNGVPPVEADEKLGWFIDLPESGERVFLRPIVRSGRLIFNTITPSDDPCSAGGSSWLMEVDPANGGRLLIDVFDLNQDGYFDDERVGDLPVSGVRDGNQGVTSMPNIVMDSERGSEIKIMSDSSNTDAPPLRENDGLNDRMPWRQIR